ncbi:DUF5134 domain-containing protein [Streptomyces sp. NPDC058872]|uniref:DUF5134 domain-containing protein n=1 Tax=Streptomyces sp. NPDC058872 TaxID=3346661 RepID=UPI003696C2A3
MHGPALSGWLLVALCAATGAYCLLRMRGRAREERRAAGSEAVMGFGMASMALPAAVLTPPDWSWVVYAAVFGAAALHGLLAVRRGGHHLHHLVGSLAMVYMAVAMGAPGGTEAHAGHVGHGAGAPGGVPLLTGGLLLYYAGYALHAGARIVPVAAATAGAPGPAWTNRPELALACRLSMALAMFAMLVTL